MKQDQLGNGCFGASEKRFQSPSDQSQKTASQLVLNKRTSKAFVSLGLLLLQIVAGSFLLQLTSYISIAIFFAWIAAAAILFRKRTEMQIT